MTQLMGRPILGLPSELDPRSPLADLLAGVRTALLTLSVVAVPVFGLWVLAPYGDDSAQGAARTAFALWLLGHGAPLARGPEGAPVTVVPLLLTVVVSVLLVRAGRRQARRARGRGFVRWRSPLAMYAGYQLVAAGAVAQCADPETALCSRAVPDLLAVAALTAGAIGYGLWAGLGRPGQLRRLPLPDVLWPAEGAEPLALRVLAGWGAALLAGGGAVFLAALLLGSAGQSAQRLGGGTAGWLGMLLACLALVPNALLWAAGYALGPGFTVGAGGHGGPLGTRLGAVPEFPLLAVLPGPRGADWHLLACAGPAAAAVVAALLLGRAATRWSAAQTAVVAAVTALAAAPPGMLAGWSCGGALGSGRMSELGPVPWQFGLAQSAWLLAVAVPGAVLTRWWHTRRGPGPTVRLRVGTYRLVCRLAA
ncbi:cell division protein PerM [Kitasatospora sp. NPDC004531]